MADFALFIDESGDFSPSDSKPFEKKIVGGVFVRCDVRRLPDELDGRFDDRLVPLLRDFSAIMRSTSGEAWFQRLARAISTYGGTSHPLWSLSKDRPTWKALHWAPLLNPVLDGSYLTPLTSSEHCNEHKAGVCHLFEAIFDAVLDRTQDAYFVAVQRAERKDHFSMPVARYRSMLFDLIATGVGMITERLTVDNLTVIISQNCYYKFEGAEESANEKSSLQAMVESGLTSMGLYDAASKTPPLILVARNHEHPLLRVADFVCGMVRREDDVDYHSLYDKYASGQNPRLKVFSAFGNLEERRARVLERDGDLTGALLQWALVASKTPESGRSNCQNDIQRLTSLLRSGQYAFSATYSLEEIIERVDRLRDRLEAQQLYELLILIENGYQTAVDAIGSDARPALLFRLRSYMLVQANHLGKRKEMGRLQQELSKSKTSVERDPSNFASVLRYQVAQTDSELNELNFIPACDIASEHLALVQLYEGEWPKCFVKGKAVYEPESNPTPLWIRAKWNAWRCELLAAPWQDGTSKELNDFLGESKAHWQRGIEGLDVAAPYSADDLSRLLGLRVLASSRIGTYDAFINGGLREAKEYMRKRHPNYSPYDISNTCRGETLALLWNKEHVDHKDLFLNSPPGGSYVNASLSSKSIGYHPQELICRDIGLARFLLDYKPDKYLKLLELGNDFLSARLLDSPIFAWLYALHGAVQAFCADRTFETEDCKKWLTDRSVDSEIVAKCTEMWDRACAWELDYIEPSSPAHKLMKLLIISPY